MNGAGGDAFLILFTLGFLADIWVLEGWGFIVRNRWINLLMCASVAQRCEVCSVAEFGVECVFGCFFYCL